MTTTQTERIVSNPDICGGKPCIAGTRIRVQDVFVWHEFQALSADEIVSLFPQLSMADVYAALAYYWDHRELIRTQMHEEDEFVERMRHKTPSALTKKLAQSDAKMRPAKPHFLRNL